MSKHKQGDLALPLYADRPQRRIPGTTCVAVTMRRVTWKGETNVAEYAIFTEDGKHLSTAHFQPKHRIWPRGYTTVSVPRINDDRWDNLTQFAIEMGRRNGLDVREVEKTRKDQHGNSVAQEGVDRCFCGCKYWEHDKCIDCGTHVSDLYPRTCWHGITETIDVRCMRCKQG